MDERDVVNDKSFEEIERRQNATKCLTYINENCFDFFFLKMHDKIDRKLDYEEFVIEKESVFENIFEYINKDKDLTFLWKTCSLTITENLSHSVYVKASHLYLKVCLKQFLKDTKDTLKFVKKRRHREEITRKREWIHV